MTTIIAYRANGGRKRHCNGICHRAKGLTCRCVCAGTYHGSALDGTLNARISEHQMQIIEKLSEEGEIIQAILMLV